MSAYTLFHVAMSLIAIAAGIGMTQGLVVSRRNNRWTLLFMVTTAITLLTSFGFTFQGFTPALGTAIVGVVIFIPTALARYAFGMKGWWRPTFVVGAILLFYFNCLVLIVQSFQKIPSLNSVAPTGGEPVVGAAQGVLLIAFVVLGYFSLRRFRPSPLAQRL